ncbi:MAG TPA: hypothetical protein VG798_00590, partial [Rhizomicrobium sp.]|nr:hypothetical protein [Rhizomicrobium sp.]
DIMGKVDDSLRGGPAPPPPPGRQARRLDMGNFNPMRVAESQLREIYDWAKTDIGFRPLLRAQMTQSAAVGANAFTYTINLSNGGLAGKGMTAEGLTIALNVPAGASITNAGGDGYKGTHAGDGGTTVAEWTLASLKPKESKQFTLTLAAPPAPGTLKGTVHWTRPKGVATDVVNINLPPPGAGRPG